LAVSFYFVPVETTGEFKAEIIVKFMLGRQYGIMFSGNYFVIIYENNGGFGGAGL